MTIRLDKREAVAWVTFDRPEARNAFTHEMYASLADICADLAADDAIRVVVFQGKRRRGVRLRERHPEGR